MNIWSFIYRASWVILAILALIALGYAVYPRVLSYRELERREAQLAEELRIEEDMLRALKERQDRLQNDPGFVEKIAREEIGLARPGETVFKFVDEDADRSAPPARR